MNDNVHPDYCWVHHVVEKPGAIRCGECFHWYASEEALVEEFNATMSRVGAAPVRSVSEIFSCAHCAHDF